MITPIQLFYLARSFVASLVSVRLDGLEHLPEGPCVLLARKSDWVTSLTQALFISRGVCFLDTFPASTPLELPYIQNFVHHLPYDHEDTMPQVQTFLEKNYIFSVGPTGQELAFRDVKLATEFAKLNHLTILPVYIPGLAGITRFERWLNGKNLWRPLILRIGRPFANDISEEEIWKFLLSDALKNGHELTRNLRKASDGKM